ncbi:MAG: methylmalonyl-CoA mutase, partial [Geobacteraceae bacterium]
LTMTKKVMDKLAAENAKDILVIVGGVIPDQDVLKLKEMGVAEVFTSGASIKEVGAFINSRLS